MQHARNECDVSSVSLARPKAAWTLVAFFLLCSSAHGQPNVDFTWLTYAQLTAERAEGDALAFGADRVRVKGEVTSGRYAGGGVLDFGANDLGESPPGTLANVVADVYFNYKIANRHLLRVGQFKTPLGMDFNTPGHLLDVTKRATEVGLSFNRDLGVMASGEPAAGLGYDVGLFNPPGRSRATNYLETQVGEDYATIGRVRYDRAGWHAEAAYGESTNAGGPGTSSYEAADVGLAFRKNRWNAKVEWIEGSGIQGIADWTETVYYLQAAYALRPTLELVARHYEGRSDLGGSSTRLSNAFLGFTAWLLETGRMSGRLQVNYVLAGHDTAPYTGLSGYRQDTLLVQFQIYAEK